METLKKYAFQLVGIPYAWGGDDPLKGFDCSGLVIELLMSAGLLPRGYDNSAQGLYNYFNEEGKSIGSIRGFGSLAFYGKSTKEITHVGFMLDRHKMLEAGGGGRNTRTVEDAAKANAYTRVRPITFRGDLVAIIKPNYKLK